MDDAKTKGAIAAIAVACLGGSGYALYAKRRTPPPPITITMPAQAVTPAPSVVPAAKPASLAVHVAGAVRHPALYTLPGGSRLNDAIQKAGGPTAQADLDAVNLAVPVKDGEKVYIPKRASAPAHAAASAPPGNALGHRSVVPAAHDPLPTVIRGGQTAEPTAASAPALGKPQKFKSPADGQVALNTATADQLQRLPGVGPSMAARILAYRAQAHGFRKIEDLQEVPGIGEKKFAKIAPYLSVD